jgi:anti-sigma regulatory factor (Ser/Thr protein kinase)
MNRGQSTAIQEFILDHLEEHPRDISRITAEQFDISRPSITKYLQSLVRNGLVEASGQTKARIYALKVLDKKMFRMHVTRDLKEDIVWRERVWPMLKDIAENVRIICNYGFTEMLNNVIDHSHSKDVEILVRLNAARVFIDVKDFGVGVFNKLMQDFHLNDPRHALLELTKGKLTSDRSKHTGQGIFFTSRAFDKYVLDSYGFAFCRFGKDDDWLFDTSAPVKGTWVHMNIARRSNRQLSQVMEEYSSELHDYGFTKTHIPLTLARYEGEQLVSRSQAKRLLSRVEQFKEVLLDFRGVTMIGQAFADEIFRVFAMEHPEVRVVLAHANEEVTKMVKKAKQDEPSPESLSLFPETETNVGSSSSSSG